MAWTSAVSEASDDGELSPEQQAKRAKAEAEQKRREALAQRIRENPGEALKSEFHFSMQLGYAQNKFISNYYLSF